MQKGCYAIVFLSLYCYQNRYWTQHLPNLRHPFNNEILFFTTRSLHSNHSGNGLHGRDCLYGYKQNTKSVEFTFWITGYHPLGYSRSIMT